VSSLDRLNRMLKEQILTESGLTKDEITAYLSGERFVELRMKMRNYLAAHGKLSCDFITFPPRAP
jgi:hypothetical protein